MPTRSASLFRAADLSVQFFFTIIRGPPEPAARVALNSRVAGTGLLVPSSNYPSRGSSSAYHKRCTGSGSGGRCGSCRHQVSADRPRHSHGNGGGSQQLFQSSGFLQPHPLSGLRCLPRVVRKRRMGPRGAPRQDRSPFLESAHPSCPTHRNRNGLGTYALKPWPGTRDWPERHDGGWATSVVLSTGRHRRRLGCRWAVAGTLAWIAGARRRHHTSTRRDISTNESAGRLNRSAAWTALRYMKANRSCCQCQRYEESLHRTTESRAAK